jgi:RimJ/RimL family protein N-acetyltransferase
MISVETPRLLLRRPEEADAEPFVIIHQDPEVVQKKQVTLTAPIGGIEVGLQNVRRMLRHWDQQGYGQWAVVEKSSAQVIGCVGLFHTKGWPGIDLSWILHRSRWGNGFATEASRAALEWAWAADIDHIISLIAPHDLRSIRVAIKIGERFERADADPVHGEPVHIYGIHRPHTFAGEPSLRS